jgi:5-methylcytosine-specific restriction endonuclease McrA
VVAKGVSVVVWSAGKNELMKNCLQCGSTDNLTTDHIIPKWFIKNKEFRLFIGLKKGLGKKNKQTLCGDCNQKKGGRLDPNHPLTRSILERLKVAVEKELLKCPPPHH